MRLDVDRRACAGHGLCYGNAPDLLDCDDQGDPIVLVDPVPEALLTDARGVVDGCPERALTLEAAP
ncbi:ferredoxin [Cryptosporangium aurantiacum]|uniref:Ferredoxin n=1 Tax=Cryptosporangium aurantiacum TaxID=134849 RepID=A0A1M7RKH1_9ACTN|nr:ferredoxin [Cryptosporangium aurantiacum]SHN46651.1 ferredoxin [Cryptosporangium aurantiacum]